MPKKTRRPGYVYITVALEEEVYDLLSNWARLKHKNIAQAVGEIVKDASPLMCIEEADAEGDSAALENYLQLAYQLARGYERAYAYWLATRKPSPSSPPAELLAAI